MCCLLRSGIEPLGEPGISEYGKLATETATFQCERYFGDYELLEEIGRGGMGIVYKARQLGLDRMVALKLLSAGPRASQDFIYRFQNEAAAASRLDHPNIVSVHEFGQHEGQYFLVMKFIAGGSLAEKIPQWSAGVQGGKRERAITGLILKIARAVHFAHQRGVLHRDLKPANILVDHDDEPYVADFGLAKITESGSNITLTQAVIGTASYMAPEQAAGGGKGATTAADIYSMGAILYELITGRPPFHGASAAEILRKVIEQEPERPRAVNASADLDLE